MHHERARLLQIEYILYDLVGITLAFFLSYWVRDSLLASYLGRLYPLPSYFWILAVALVSVPIIFSLLGHYEVESLLGEDNPLRLSAERLLKGIALEYILFSVLVFSLKLHYVSRLLLLLFFTAALLLLAVIRAAWWPRLSRLASKEPRRLLVAGSGGNALEFASFLSRKSRVGTRVIGFITERASEVDWLQGLPVLGTVKEAETVLSRHSIDEVLVAVPESNLRRVGPLLQFCQRKKITARLACDFLPRGSARPYLEQLEGVPLLTFATTPKDADLLALKRITDVVLSLFLIVLTSPLFILAALSIKLTSKGPVLYRQVRCGLDGRAFVFLKFRSMVEGADEAREKIAHLNEAEGPIFKISTDPRVTRIGRILRRTSIDELPQLFNALRGEMSLVGPRPPLPEEVVRYDGWQRRRLSMKPGLTCLWQVSGRSALCFKRWVELDLRYIDNWSPWLDLKIMLRTVPAVASLKGAW